MMTHVPGFSSGKLSRAAARVGRAAFVGVAAGALVALTASASFAGVPSDVTADSWVSKAKADVFKANLGGQLAGTGAYVAVNDGVLQQVEGVKVPELPLIGSQNLLSGSVLAQDAVASDSGFSAACAAIMGQGGSIKIGSDNSCLLEGDGKFSIALGSIEQLGLGSVLGDGVVPGLDALNLDNVTGNLGLPGLPVSDLNLPVLSDLDLSALDLSTLKALQLPTGGLPDVQLKIVGRALSSECLATPTDNFGRSTPLKAQIVADVAGQQIPVADLPTSGQSLDLDLNTLLTKVQGALPANLPAVGQVTQILGTVLATLPTDALKQVQLAKIGVGIKRESVGKVSVTALSVSSAFPAIANLRLGQVECNSSASPSAKDIPQDRQSAQGPSSDKADAKVSAKVDADKPEAKVAAKGEGATVNANIAPAGQGTPIAPIGWSAAAAVLLAGIALAGFKLRQARRLGTANTEK